ncbi:MAG: CRTAC1 family protein, partial [Verrucomicrobiales bacterium]
AFRDSGLELDGLVTSALWSDIDSDGWIDLAITEEWGPLRILLNEQGKLVDATEKAGIDQLTGWWNGLDGADFDGDGDIDFVATNFGLNTKYHASVEHPTLLYYGDFENTGQKNIVEAEFEDETLYPVRGRSCSSNAMPHLKKTYTSFKQFAISELSDIYSPERLDDSLRLAATTLESGVFINESAPGNTVKFSFHPLPRIAQIAPGFGVVATDVDRDGNPDIYLAQNFYSPQVETGRMAGGVSQLLLGNGDGSFEPIPADQSGLLVGGDAASLTRVDLDSDGLDDFVVGINNAAPKCFLNRVEGATAPLRIDLVGGAGNPKGIGARVRVIPDQGEPAHSEVRAGGGYLSQSPSTLSFFLPGAKQAKEIHIRWPDGSESTFGPVAASGSIMLSKD